MYRRERKYIGKRKYTEGRENIQEGEKIYRMERIYIGGQIIIVPFSPPYMFMVSSQMVLSEPDG